MGGVYFAEYGFLMGGPFDDRNDLVGVNIYGLFGIGVFDWFGWFDDGGDWVVL